MADPFDDTQAPPPGTALGATQADPFDSTQAPPQPTSTFSDIKNLFGIGITMAAQDTREIARKLLPESVIHGIDSIDTWMHGKPSDEFLKGTLEKQQQALSPEQQASGEKLWWDDKTSTFGPAWKDPRAYLGGVVESLPETLITMSPSLSLAKGAYALKLSSGLAAGLTEEAAAKVAAGTAAKTAYLSGAAGEGALAGGQSSRQVRDEILALSPDVLAKSDAYNSLLKGGMTPDQAKQSLANDASTKAFVLAGVTTGMFGGAGDAFLARAFTRGIEGGFAARVAKGMVSEGVLEEFPQSYLQQVSENYAKQPALPDTKLTAGALDQAFQGTASGAVMGGAFGAASREAHVPAAPAPVPAPKVDPVASIGNAANVDEALAAFEKALDVSPEDIAGFNLSAPLSGLFTEPPPVTAPFNWNAALQGQQQPEAPGLTQPSPPLEAPSLALPNEPAAPSQIITDAPSTRDVYADALVKSQRGELLTGYERALLDNPPETPALATEPASKPRAAHPFDETQGTVYTPEAPAQNVADGREETQGSAGPQPASDEDRAARAPANPVQGEASAALPAGALAEPASRAAGGDSGAPGSAGGVPPVHGAPAAESASSNAVAPQFKDFLAPKADKARGIIKGQILSFKNEKGAALYAKANKLKDYVPRASEGGFILSKPVVPRSEAQKANDARLRDRAVNVQPGDSLRDLLRKSGGINAAELTTDGADGKAIADTLRFGAARKEGGLSLDGAAELMAQHGYDVKDEHGTVDASKARELIQDVLDGKDVYAPEGHELRGARAEEPPPERRVDTGQRKRVADMTPEEKNRALLTDDLTGLGNRRAYEEAPRKAVHVSADADGLKWINDNMGHGAGDDLIRAIGTAMKEEGLDAFHISGDEFAVRFDNEEEAYEAMARVHERLDRTTITAVMPDGTRITKTGVGLSYGLAENALHADHDLQRSKLEREESGIRAPRGVEPSGVAREAPGQADKARGAARTEGEGGIADQPQGEVRSSPETAAPQTPSNEGVSVSEEAAKPTQYEMTSPLTVEFGGKSYPVADVVEAQRKWVDFREESGKQGGGVRDIGNGIKVKDAEGKVVATITYNGTVLAPDGREIKSAAEARALTKPSPADAGLAASGAPALELKGETEAEIKTREALAAKEAAGKAKRTNAPSEKDFTLTGSNSPADEARARGQMELAPAETKSDQRGKKPMLRQGESTAGSQVPAVRKWLADVVAKSRVRINVVQSTTMAPFEVAADAKGAYHEGKVWVFADNITDALDAEKTVARHELLHAGYDILYGDKGARAAALNALLAKNRNVRDSASAWRVQYGQEFIDQTMKDDPSLTREAATREMMLRSKEEGVAYFSQDSTPLNGWREFLAVIQAGMRRIGLSRYADALESMTNAEAQKEIAKILKATEETVDTPSSGAVPAFSQKAPIFYSDLARQVESVKTESASAAQWKATIQNLKGVKADEIAWSGLNDWLDLQDGKVTKQQVSDFLAQNGVKIEETMLGGKLGTEYREAAVRAAELNEKAQGMWPWVENVLPETLAQTDRANLPWWAGEAAAGMPGALEKIQRLGLNESQFDKLWRYGEARAEAAAAAKVRDGLQESGAETKFGRYTLPGGENYHELLLTLPRDEDVRKEAADKANDEYNAYVDANRAKYGERKDFPSEVDKETRRLEKAFYDITDAQRKEDFRSSHFDQPNILAHVRFDERTDAEGKKVLFIEELQSDWAQKGKREGFREAGNDYYLRKPDGEIGRDFASYEEGVHYILDHPGVGSVDRSHREGIPSAPFVGKTEAWVALAVKRMIRYAAENGFDRVAFTTGEQQADRYDLSKHINSLLYAKRDNGEYRLKATLRYGNDPQTLAHSVPESKLAEHVGKDVADKIIRGEGEEVPHTRMRQLTGLDLKVGGEGMKSFYDKIVPNVVNDVLKKLGGDRVREVKMEMPPPAGVGIGEWKTTAQPGFDVTPAMREKVKGGVPLFSRAGFNPTEETPEAPKGAPAWVAELPKDMQETLRKAGAWRPQETLQDRIVGWIPSWQAMKQGIVDQFDPIKSLDFHAYMLARMSKSSAGPLESMLFDGAVYLDKDGAVDVNYEKGGFVGLMQKLQGEHDRFFSWVIGNRAERLMEEGRERNFTPEDIERLKTLNQGTMADGKSRQAVYMQALADLNRYNKAAVDMAEGAGLVNGEDRPFWEKDFYIPFYRAMENDKVNGPIPKKGLVRQYAFKTLKGGAEAIGDPMENILKNWAHLIDASLKNNAARASILAAEKAGVAMEAKEEEARQMAKAMGNKNTVVYFMDGGQQRHFIIDDPFVLDAINSLAFAGFSGPAMKVMSAFKRWLTYGTTISPTFRIRNIVRDSIAMIGTNPASYNVLGNVLTGWKMTEEGSPVYSSMIAGGGVMRFGSFTEGDNGRAVKRLIDAGVDSATILDSTDKVKGMLTAAYDWWMHVGDRSENINRAAIYQQLRDQGKSHLEASYAARDTMDFSMQGTWAAIRFLTQTVPFFNARLQGLYKLGRGAAEDPRRFAYVIGATALASMALLLAYKDDDDWKRREDWDRETYWWFKIGNKAFRIPKPFEIGAIATMAERALEVFATNDLTGKQFAARMGNVVSQQLSMNPVPQLFMPMIEVWANQNTFTNRPIESQGMEALSPARRSQPDTSAFAQLLGKNNMVSPVQIDHLISGYFGWLGMHAVATADLALRPAMGAPGKPTPKIDDVFVLGDFVKDTPAYQSKYLTRLYQQGKEVQQLMADLRQMQKVGAIEQAREFIADNRDQLKLAPLYAAADHQLTAINQRIKMVQLRDADPEDKRKRLDELYALRNRIAAVTEERVRERTQ